MSVTTVNTEFLKNAGAANILNISYIKMPDNQVFYDRNLKEKTLSGVYGAANMSFFTGINTNHFNYPGTSDMDDAFSGQYLYFLDSNKNILNSKFSCSAFSFLSNGAKVVNTKTLELVVTAKQDVTLDKIVLVHFTGNSGLLNSSAASISNSGRTCIEIFNIDQIALVIASGEMKKFVFNINIV